MLVLKKILHSLGCGKDIRGVITKSLLAYLKINEPTLITQLVSEIAIP